MSFVISIILSYYIHLVQTNILTILYASASLEEEKKKKGMPVR